MENNKYLLIWDIDGTLIQGRGVGRRAMDKAFLELYGIAEGFKDISMAGRIDAVILQDAYTKHNITATDKGSFLCTYCKYLEKDVKELISPIDAPGILDLLNFISRKDNLFNVLGTGNFENAARIKLSKHDMNTFFSTGGFGDNAKERWQVIEEAINKAEKLFNMTFCKENIYVIGDTPKDIECGIKLGIKSVGVATGSHTSDQLKEYNPDHVFEDLTDLESFMAILNN